MIVAVDANIILSALLGGKSGTILFDSRFRFITTQFTLGEVKKYLPRLSKKLHVTVDFLETTLYLLPIKAYNPSTYRGHLLTARQMIEHIDPKDIDILALALQYDCPLWSQDKDFDQTGYAKILKTYQLL